MHQVTVSPARFAPQAKAGVVQDELFVAGGNVELGDGAAPLQKEPAEDRPG